MRYEITDGVLYVFDENSEIPFLAQPTWASGDPWKAGEAEAWAEQLILSLTDPTAELAGPSPETPTEPRPIAEEAASLLPPPPTPEELEALKAEQGTIEP